MALRLLLIILLFSAHQSTAQFMLRPQVGIGFANWRLNPDMVDSFTGERVVFQNSGLTYHIGLEAIQRLKKYSIGLLVNYQQTLIQTLESNSATSFQVIEISEGSINSFQVGMLLAAHFSQEWDRSRAVELLYGLSFTTLPNASETNTGLFIQLGYRFGFTRWALIPYYQFNRLRAAFSFPNEVVNIHHNLGMKVGYQLFPTK